MQTQFLAGIVGAPIVMVLAAAPPATAQIDYRNLDDERPVTTEDAYPVERYGFELLAPYRFESSRGDVDVHALEPELEYGIAANTQVSAKALLAAVHTPTGTDWGLAGMRLSGLYNFNTESSTLPALAVRTDAFLPIGSLAGDVVRLTIKAIATRSWGRTRAHLNAAVGLGDDVGLGPVDTSPRWLLSAAIDQSFIRQSLLAVAEVVTRRTVRGAPVEVNASAGLRWQWTPLLVIDAGISRRLSSRGPDFGATIGVSRVFAVKGLMPGGAP